MLDNSTIERRFAILRGLGPDAGVGGGRKWWRLGSTQRDQREHAAALPINDQLGVDLESMRTSIGARWTRRFDVPAGISAGFVYREYKGCRFVSVCEGATSDAPNSGNIVAAGSAIARSISEKIREQLQQPRSSGRPPPVNRVQATATTITPARRATNRPTAAAIAAGIASPPGNNVRRELLIDESGAIRPGIVSILNAALKGRNQLTEPEQRLMGGLVDVALKGNAKPSPSGKVKVLTVKGGFGCRPYDVARVPGKYSRPTETGATKRRDTKIAVDWMNLVHGNFSDKFAIRHLRDNPNLASDLRMHSTHLRLSPEQSASVQAFVGINDTQLKKLSRAMFFHFRVRFFASQNAIAVQKSGFISDQFRTLRYDVEVMKRKVKVGNGKTTFFRDTKVLVTTIRMEESVLCSLQHLLVTKNKLPGAERYGTPFRVHEDFQDTVLVKASMDAGGGSTKMICNLVDVANPQGQQHVRPAMEYSGGVKDDAHNVRIAFKRVKEGFESLCHRRVVALRLLVKGTNKMQTVLATNKDKNHNHLDPKPLPKLSGVTTEKAQWTEDEHKNGLIQLDFTTVSTVKMLCDSERTSLSGLSFFDSDAKCIGTVHFRQSIDDINAEGTDVSLDQFIVASVFTADIDCLSMFRGHQGPGATYCCTHCLAMLSDMLSMWEDETPTFPRRTNKLAWASWNKYQSMYGNQLKSRQTKALRKTVTVNHTYSTAHMPQANIPDDCYTTANLHVRMGNSLSILNDFIFKFVNKVEAMTVGPNSSPLQTRATIETALEQMASVLEWVKEELSETTAAIKGRSQYIDTMLERMTRIQTALDLDTLSNDARQKLEADLAKLEEENEQIEESTQRRDEELQYQVQLMEFQSISADNKAELEALLKKHEGHAKRIVVSVLKSVGVDIQIYFKGVMNGVHCMKMAEKRVEIMDEITKQLLEFVNGTHQEPLLKKAIKSFDGQMKKILGHWYDLMVDMKRTGKMSQAAKSKFRSQRQKLKTAIVDMIERRPPLPGADNPFTHPTQRKWHVLFCDIDGQIKDWSAIGSLDEENTETCHAKFNEKDRRFGSTRGMAKKKNQIEAWLFDGAPFIQDGICDILEGTKAKRATTRPAKKRRVRKDESWCLMDSDELVPRGDALTPLEVLMNDNKSFQCLEVDDVWEGDADTEEGPRRVPIAESPDHKLHSVLSGMDTKLYVCTKCPCRKRIIGKAAFSIHQNELHSTSICAESDGPQDETMMKVAFGMK